MIPFADKTITIFNKVDVDLNGNNKPVEMWVKHVLHNCYWGNVRKRSFDGTGFVLDDEILVQIPQNENFVDFWDWVKLPQEELSEKLSGTVGTLLVLGDVADEIAVGSSEQSIIGKYQGRAFLASSFSNNTGDGVPLPHYAFRG